MKRYELLSFKDPDTRLHGIDTFIDWEYREAFHSIPNRPNARISGISECLSFLVLRHLEFETTIELVNRCIRFGTDIVADFFFGTWMEGEFAGYFDPHGEWREYMEWLAPFWGGLLFAFLSNDDDQVQRLTEWVTEDLPHNNTARDLLQGDSAFYKLISYYLSGRSCEFQGEWESGIGKARGKRAKMLLGCLRALRAKDAEVFEEALGSYLKRYLTAELDGRYIYDYISIEASLLWHAARMRGLTIPGFAGKQQALIITRQTIGLE